MRLDKFLQVSRLVKRRALAAALAEKGRVQINGRRAKPATTVNPGDRLEITYGSSRLVATVARVPEGNVRAGDAATLYEVVERAGADEFRL